MILVQVKHLDEGLYFIESEEDIYDWLEIYCMKYIDMGVNEHDVYDGIMNGGVYFYKGGKWNTVTKCFDVEEIQIDADVLCRILYID